MHGVASLILLTLALGGVATRLPSGAGKSKVDDVIHDKEDLAELNGRGPLAKEALMEQNGVVKDLEEMENPETDLRGHEVADVIHDKEDLAELNGRGPLAKQDLEEQSGLVKDLENMDNPETDLRGPEEMKNPGDTPPSGLAEKGSQFSESDHTHQGDEEPTSLWCCEGCGWCEDRVEGKTCCKECRDLWIGVAMNEPYKACMQKPGDEWDLKEFHECEKAGFFASKPWKCKDLKTISFSGGISGGRAPGGSNR